MKYIDIYFPNNAVVGDKDEEAPITTRDKSEDEFYIHICSRYIVIYDSKWKALYSFAIRNQEKLEGQWERWYIKQIHPLSIEKRIIYNRTPGNLENGVLKLASRIEIDMKNI
jgi:hypothetical protein